ncbi:helix-turn-helix transcriptional regulator [Clostridium neonatale]|uniref:HTH-type transcriptional regulator, competence development regulator n=1 Tax=Clostridium neonatale TaxID=137838 RepID=A0AAD1YBV2_9CLOT|nr:helix-turn-helix transcriptional regulator [Clostridium neonatale]CAI3194832.1 HTH-type transcriptional regulator, competence development regulator [Clostridium neonatale]CAI3196587.1 HTH-type transcriptional regulator, competence development regulator [Clostridium neonatale]CAI3203085.1 HTH-type transcriptional regulator, competence development regulator [Clostridium neonatale]CAI3217516.1 HTH-type transcriptional regulator, competence development regulator [Clostridium neonatale]CAI322531
MSVGDKLRVLRKQNNLTLKELSEKTNLSISFISDIENKRRNPSIDNLKLLANALNVSVSDLLDEKLYTPKANKFNDDDDLRRIERARNKMNPEQKEKMMDILRTVFDDLFDD